MKTALLLTSTVFLISLVGVVVLDYYRGRHPLLSNRNFLLLGLGFFQCLSAILTLSLGMRNYGVEISDATYLRFGGGMVLFTIVFFMAYRCRRPASWLANRIPTRSPSPTILPIILILGIAVIAGLESRFTILPLPGLVRNLTLPVGRGLCCFSIVMLLWVWNEHRLNAVAWLICPPLILVMLLSLLQGEFGRRAVLSGVLAVAWGMYFFRWQFKTAILNTPKYAVYALALLLFIGGVTAIRAREAETYSLSYRIRAVAEAISLEQAREVFLTDTFSCSVYAIERYTTDLAPQPFHSTWYMMTYLVPREMWEAKPVPLGEILPAVVTVTELKRYNWGPGLMGHAWHEGGFLLVVYFAIGFGVICAAIDQRLMQQTSNPYFVAIAGAALGQVLAMARGDIGFFAVNWFYGTAGPMLLVYLAGLFSNNRADLAADAQMWEDQWEEDEYEEEWSAPSQPA